MTIADYIKLGYRFYKNPPTENIECDCLYSIGEHARNLRSLLDVIQPMSMDSDLPDASRDWERVGQWLQMAAGLEFVNVELLSDNESWICGTAFDHDYAHNYLASLYATEETRLIYVWSAVERLLEVLAIPSYAEIEDKFIYDRAAALLSEKFSEEVSPRHYLDVYAHLEAHIQHDPELREDRRLFSAREIRPWRTESGILLTIGNAMRNFPAHGDVDVPIPADWSDAGSKWLSTLPYELHARRLATRGLLLSTQMLLAVTCRYREDYRCDMPSGGWWVHQKEHGWKRSAAPLLADLLLSAHVRAPAAAVG